MNVLFCSAGRRGELVRDFKRSMEPGGRVVATDSSPYAPAIYLADARYIVPRIDDPCYLDRILEICRIEAIDAVTTFIDPEIEVLARNRARFEEMDVQVLAPYEGTAHLCFDKFEMYRHLVANGISTVLTFGDLASFEEAQAKGEIDFPVFVKPRTGSGSVGARRVGTMAELEAAWAADPTLIAQELMEAGDVDTDVYVDTVSHKLVSAFTKRKISTTIGGANKTVSFKDERFFEAIRRAVGVLELNGPADMDFFCRDGEYLLSEVNPRFGGAYLHAYGAGVDFVKMIENNVHGVANEPVFGDYEDGIVMMMFDSVVIKGPGELAE